MYFYNVDTMKAFVSYVLQDRNGHEHLSEVLDFKEPPYTFSNDPPVSQVMEWANVKRKQLAKGTQLIVINIFKV